MGQETFLAVLACAILAVSVVGSMIALARVDRNSRPDPLPSRFELQAKLLNDTAHSILREIGRLDDELSTWADLSDRTLEEHYKTRSSLYRQFEEVNDLRKQLAMKADDSKIAVPADWSGEPWPS